MGSWHAGRRAHAPLAADPWASLRDGIADQLHEVRRQELSLWSRPGQDEAAWAAALRRADAWLAVDPALRDSVRALWVAYGDAKLKEGDFRKIRDVLDHLDQQSLSSPQAEPLRKTLCAAQTLAAEAGKLAREQAELKLEEALALWPRAPGVADELAKLTKTYRVLHVAVRQLPGNLSPATAWTNAEKQALDLLFSRLVQVRFDAAGGQYYLPEIVAGLPQVDGRRQHIELRRDAYWSDGERLTTADVRHTAQLLATTSTWRDLLEVPRFEGQPFSLDITLKQGLLDPLAPLAFHVLPQKYRDQPLRSATDPAFASAPVGSGPFRYVGQAQEGTRTVAVFRTNPAFNRYGKQNAVREVRLVAWKDEQTSEQPRCQFALDVPSRDAGSLTKLGFADVRSLPTRRVYFLAANHRTASLTNQDLRRALGLAISRKKILQDVFHAAEGTANPPVALNGPFPLHSWASCPPPRVPLDIFQPELAKSFAKKAGQQLGPIRLSLKFPADVPGVKEACAAITEQMTGLFAQVKVDLVLTQVPLTEQQMRDAIGKRDYELAYHHWDFPDNNFWLWPLFDPHPDAMLAGGSNFLGYDNDAKLQGLLRSAMSHRQFATVRDYQQSIHAHLYEHMPLIPLWQIPPTVAIHPSLTVPNLDAEQVFANILDWKLP